MASQTFVILYRPGPTWLADKPAFEQPLQAHGDYMHTLFERGQLVRGGPFIDNAGGLAMIRAENLDAANQILQSDPALQSEVMTATVHPWFEVNWERYGQPPEP